MVLIIRSLNIEIVYQIQNSDKDMYSLVLANPPFKGSLDAESVSGDLLKVCKTQKNGIAVPCIILTNYEDWGEDVHVSYRMAFYLVDLRHTSQYGKKS